MDIENEAIDACDAPLLELQIQIASVWNDRKRLRAEIEAANNSLLLQIEYSKQLQAENKQQAKRIRQLEQTLEERPFRFHTYNDIEEIEQLQSEIERLKRKAKRSYCPDCGFGFDAFKEI